MCGFRDKFGWILVLPLILGVGVGLILVAAGVVYGFKWIWSLLPFGASAIILGVLILSLVIFDLVKTRRQTGIEFDRHIFGQLNFFQIAGFLFGFALTGCGISWFFLPAAIIRILPSFGESLFWLLVGCLLFVGIGETIRQLVSIIREREYLYALFLFFVFAIGILLINAPIWNLSEKLPLDYYLPGKILFVFLLFLQTAFLVIFYTMPGDGERGRRGDKEKGKRGEGETRR